MAPGEYALPAGTWCGAQVCQPAALGLDQSTLRSDKPWGPYSNGKGAQGERVTGHSRTSGSAAKPRENGGAEHPSLPTQAAETLRSAWLPETRAQRELQSPRVSLVLLDKRKISG